MSVTPPPSGTGNNNNANNSGNNPPRGNNELVVYTPPAGQSSNTAVGRLFTALERSSRAQSVSIKPVLAGVTSDEDDTKVVECITEYASEICGSANEEAQTAVMLAFMQSGISHSTSPEAQKDASLKVHFDFGGRSREYSKKDFNAKLRSKISTLNPERRFLKKNSEAVYKLLNDKVLNQPTVAASKHGALEGYENTAVDFLRLKPGVMADDARASNVLVSRQALGGRGKASTKYVNVSQIIDAARAV